MKKKEILNSYIIMESPTESVDIKKIETVKSKNDLMFLRYHSKLQSFNIKNRNGRIYNGSSMRESTNTEHLIELLSKGSLFGEAGHPHTEDVKRILCIDPTNISHRICSFDHKGDILHGVLETLTNDIGRNKTNLILQGLKPAYSLRALAQLTKKSNGDVVMDSKAHIVTYDWVILPSHKEAYIDDSKPIHQVYKNINGVGMQVNESTLIPIKESQILNYIKNESFNIKIISSICEVALKNIRLSSDRKKCIVKEGNNTYVMQLEKYIQNDIENYMSSF